MSIATQAFIGGVIGAVVAVFLIVLTGGRPFR